MNSIVKEDIDDLVDSFIFNNKLCDKTVLITGASGLIGSLTILFLDELNKKYDLNMKIIAAARNIEKGKKYNYSDAVSFYKWDRPYELNLNYKIDYIIHTACPTQSKYLVSNPVEVINDTFLMAKSLLEYCKAYKSSIVYLSSIEIYGQNNNDDLIDENDYKYVDQLNIRSCYPESKRLIECLFKSYSEEYDLDVKIARLTQTFGAGINTEDNRIFLQFVKSVVNNENIVLHTKGNTSKSYLYTMDAINALFFILFKGEKGEAYNVANEETYISVYDLADFLKKNFNGNISIIYDLKDDMGYAPESKINLNTEKIKTLGWKCSFNLYSSFERLIKYLNQCN